MFLISVKYTDYFIIIYKFFFNFRMGYSYNAVNDHDIDGVRKTIRVTSLFNNEVGV